MDILVLNVGSSSIKYSVYSKNKLVMKGLIERIKSKEEYQNGIKHVFSEISKRELQIDLIGHRVVHGGEIKRPQKITRKLLQYLRKIKELAPLHQTPEIYAIEECLILSPKAKQIAVFDTAFHQTMPEKAFLYGLPYKYYFKDRIRRYGFHGMSHQYVSAKAAELMHKKNSRIITCHLGNGCSITAVKNGKSIDTSMGFTPLEGLIMGTRSGSIDPSIVLYFSEKRKMTIKQIKNLLNFKSGMLGISGVSNDFRDLLKASSKNKRAKLAVDMLVYDIQKYIGAYIAAMNGVDAIVFTGGVGENSSYLRKEALKNFGYIRIKIDDNKNNRNETIISASSSKIKVFVIKTDEERIIAEEAMKV